MTTIDINWSNAVARQQLYSLSGVADPITQLLGATLPQDLSRATVAMQGSTLTISFPDGTALAVGGISQTAAPGGRYVIHADSVELHKKDAGTVDLPGQYAITYSLADNVPRIEGFSGTISGVSAVSEWPAGTWSWDGVLGNVSVQAAAALTLDGTGALAGQLSGMSFSSTNGYLHGTVTGTFGVSGASLFGGSPAAFTAAIQSADIAYADGSWFRISGGDIHAKGLDVTDFFTWPADGASFAGDDVVNFDIGESTTLFFNSGAGNDTVSLDGGPTYYLDTGAGNDTIRVLMGTNSIEGGSGFDTVVYTGHRADYNAREFGTGWASVDNLANTKGALLHGVERVLFDDGALAYDFDGFGGQAYRLYSATLGRAPDAAGLGYWISVLDKGASLFNVASGFIDSPEFARLVGANASNETFIAKLYENVLHRSADAAGLHYWVEVLDHGAGRAGVVVEFSESTENKAQVVGSIENGIDYIPYA